MPRPRKTTPATTPTIQPTAAMEAFNRLADELKALAEEELIPINVEVSLAVNTVLGALPNVQHHRVAIEDQLPKRHLEMLDKLEDVALATWYADALHTHSGEGDKEAYEALKTEAATLREGLLVAAEALAYRKLLEKEQVATIRSGQGNQDLANDLIELSNLFTKHWSSISSKTAAERAEVDRAAELGPQLLVMLAARKAAQSNKGQAKVDTADQLARAYTLLDQAYSECRRAVSYLRWHEGDADSLTPPVKAKKAPRKKKAAAEESESTDTVTDETNDEFSGDETKE
jgi:hypothetical protein